MLTANAVNYSIESDYLLKDISLTIEPKSVLVVLGPNGAGKTTLLKTMSGEISPSGGSVFLHKRKFRDWQHIERAKTVAVLPQHSLLNFPFLAAEVVGLGRFPHNTGVQRDAEIVALAMAEVDASHLKYRDYQTLSGGEKQRIHLARVLAQIWGPEHQRQCFLLLDEPTASLDLAHQHSILRTARSMARRGVGVMIILHDLNLAAHYADQIVILKAGEIYFRGGVCKALTEENIRNVFDVNTTVMAHPRTERPLIAYEEDSSVKPDIL